MGKTVYTPSEILQKVASNPLRRYPGVAVGQDRLLPYARPQISTSLSAPESGAFFVAGNCFARGMEKALRRADRTVLSSPTDLDLPGDAKQQFNRFNIFNLDVNYNEFRWALTPNDHNIDDALIDVDGLAVDMQIHTTFAHDPETARHYRRVFNSSYQPVVDADVIILSPLGIEQWYDAEKDLYLNAMPTQRMTDLYPDRFEFHRLGLFEVTASIERCCLFLQEHSNRSPVILLAPAPVWQSMVHTDGDSMIDQFYSKSVQRLACEAVADSLDRVEYVPSIEMGLLSDFRFGYTPASPNHNSQSPSDRLIAEVLLKYEGPSVSQRQIHALGHCSALLTAEDYDAAVRIGQQAYEAGVPVNSELDLYLSQALIRSGDKAAGMRLLIGNIPQYPEDDENRAHRFEYACNLARGAGTPEDLVKLQLIAERFGLRYEPIELSASAARAKSGTTSKAEEHLAPLWLALRQDRADFALGGCYALEKDTLEWGAADRERFETVFTQALQRTGQKEVAISRLIAALDGGTVSSTLFQLAVNLTRSHSTKDRVESLQRLALRDNYSAEVLTVLNGLADAFRGDRDSAASAAVTPVTLEPEAPAEVAQIAAEQEDGVEEEPPTPARKKGPLRQLLRLG